MGNNLFTLNVNENEVKLATFDYLGGFGSTRPYAFSVTLKQFNHDGVQEIMLTKDEFEKFRKAFDEYWTETQLNYDRPECCCCGQRKAREELKDYGDGYLQCAPGTGCQTEKKENGK